MSGGIRDLACDPGTRYCVTDPHLELSLTPAGLEVRAELRCLANGVRWPVVSRPYCLRSAKGVLICDFDLMAEVRADLLDGGFRPLPRPGLYRLIHPEWLDQVLEKHVDRWKRSGYEVDLDRRLSSLLEGKYRVRSCYELEPVGGSGWFEMKWRVESGGRDLTPGDLRTLRLFPGRYYLLDGGRPVSVQPGELKQEIDELLRMGYSPFAGGSQRIRTHHLESAVRLASEQDQRPETTHTLPDPLADLCGQLQRLKAIDEAEPPEGFRGVLRAYQRRGLSFLDFLARHGFGGILADEMGLGKTVQTLALLERKRQELGRKPSLVVCPTSVAPNWIEEAARFTPRLRGVHLKNGADLRQCGFGDYDLIVVSYALLHRNELSQDFRYVILDEAQLIKNPRAKRTRSAKRLQAEHRLALTGTPIENGVMELWSIFDFLMPGFLGLQTHFRRVYERSILKGEKPEQMAKLAGHVRPFILRRLKTEVAPELPPKVEQNIYCELNPKQKQLYARVALQVRGELFKEIERKGWEKSQLHVLTALLRLRQICCHPSLADAQLARIGSGKLDAFVELLKSILGSGHRVIVFSQFVSMLKILRAVLQADTIPCLYLDGQTRDRWQVVKQFQSEDEIRVFLMSLKAGGTGLNLTAADYVVLYDPWWNPAVESQAIDRIHRLGQSRPVTAYRMITLATIEEKMLRLKERKKDLAERVLKSEAEFLQRLTPEDLESLLAV